jgi:hypothetical protein
MPRAPSAELFLRNMRVPPAPIDPSTRLAPIRQALQRTTRSTYTLRRTGLPPLYLTQDLLACFFDLTARQAVSALRTCDTTIKRLRVWSGLVNWPCREVHKGTHAHLTLDWIQEARRHHIDTTRDTQPEVHQALLRACEIARGDPPAAAPAQGPEPDEFDFSDEALGMFDANAFKWTPEDAAFLAELQ